MSRNSAERSRYKKYDYKTHHSTFTQRSESQHHTDPPSASRKTSAFKTRKESTENSLIVPEMDAFEDIRLPLGEIFENSAKVARALIDPRRDGRALRNRNAELELKVGRQAKELEDLKAALDGMRELVGAQRAREGQEIREANFGLQARCEAQDREMATLRKEMEGLKIIAEKEGFLEKNSEQLEESHVSRRAQYKQNYESVASNIPMATCAQCMSMGQEIEQLRLRHEAELLRGKSDQRIQEARLVDLQAELQHKNKCINYLRDQVEQYERNSKQLVWAVSSLEDTKTKRQQGGRGTYVRSKPDEAFNSFSQFRY